MSRPRTTPAKPASTQAPEVVEAPNAPATTSEPAPPAEPDPVAEPAAEAKPEAAADQPAATAEPEAPVEPPMPEPPPDEPAELRADGPTPSEWVAAGYPSEAYPPHGYAVKPDAPIVEHYKVTRYCRYFRNGVVSTWHEGQVIDSVNFDIADVRAQGLPITRCSPEDKNLKPSIGHWSV